MKIYLIQFTDKKGNSVGTPYLTASKKTADSTLKACIKSDISAYVNMYEVKTGRANISSYAVAQYYDETEAPF